jgi:hypothetical protein
MTTALSIFMTLLPYILQIAGLFFGYAGVKAQAHPDFSKQPVATQNVYGAGQVGLGGTLFAVGTGMHAVQSHKLAAGVQPPTPLNPSGSISPNPQDPAAQSLVMACNQINAKLEADIRVLRANAARRIGFISSASDAGKVGL